MNPMSWLNKMTKKKHKGKSKKRVLTDFNMPESSKGKIKSTVGEAAVGKRKIPKRMRGMSLKMSPQAPSIKLHGHGYTNASRM